MVATVDVTEPLGSEVTVHFSAGPHQFTARVEPTTEAREGNEHPAVFNMNKVHIFDKETEERVV